MTFKGFKLRPVAWMTWLLAVLTGVEAVNEAAHLLPAAWSPYLLGAIALLTGILGKLAHDKVTPLAAPKDDAGVPLVPKWVAQDSATPPVPPGAGGGVGGAGMSSWGS